MTLIAVSPPFERVEKEGKNCLFSKKKKFTKKEEEVCLNIRPSNQMNTPSRH